MKILLIEPARYDGEGALRKPRQLLIAPLAFPMLAALTPPDCELSVVNESFEEVDFSAPADLVGITAYSQTARRAYEIADAFRRRGTYVVMGGVHASLMPQEAAAHADTVVVGEAEQLWPRFLEDLKRGRPEPVYRNDAPPSLAGLPLPRFSALRGDWYFALSGGGPLGRVMSLPIYTVQTARGCAGRCSFCSLPVLSGGTYRPRPVPEVIAEMRALGGRGYFLIDDDIFCDRERAAELFRAMLPLKTRWFGQGTLAAGDDPELLDLAYRSGCRVVLVGVETVSPATLARLDKPQNVLTDYSRQLAAYNASGIGVSASMFFSYDMDAPASFGATADFLAANGVPYSVWRPLIPFPGTEYHETLRREGRLKYERWWLDAPRAIKVYDKTNRHGMTEREYLDGITSAYFGFYSLPGILRRLLLPPRRGWPLKLALNLLVWLAGCAASFSNPLSGFLFGTRTKD